MIHETLYIEEGCDFQKSFLLSRDVTAFTVTAAVSKYFESTVYTIPVTVTNAATGAITLALTKAQNTLPTGTMFYDVFLETLTTKEKIAKGQVVVMPSVN